MNHEILGVVGVLIAPGSGVVAHAADFDRSGYGGYTLREAQELRVRAALANEYVTQSCNGVVAKQLRGYDAAQLLSKLCRNDGFIETYIPIGYAEDGEA